MTRLNDARLTLLPDERPADPWPGIVHSIHRGTDVTVNHGLDDAELKGINSELQLLVPFGNLLLHGM